MVQDLWSVLFYCHWQTTALVFIKIKIGGVKNYFFIYLAGENMLHRLKQVIVKKSVENLNATVLIWCSIYLYLYITNPLGAEVDCNSPFPFAELGVPPSQIVIRDNITGGWSSRGAPNLYYQPEGRSSGRRRQRRPQYGEFSFTWPHSLTPGLFVSSARRAWK